MNDTLIIYGNGHMARMFYHFASTDFRVSAFTVDKNLITDCSYCGVPILPFETIEQYCATESHQMITAVGFVGMNDIRAERYRAAKDKGYRFANYIHPSVTKHPDLILGENNVILDHVSLHPGVRLGTSNFLCSNISIGHGCSIENNCWINSGVAIAGETIIQSNCFLGPNATIGDNIVIAERCYVGANTLVTRSTQANEVYVSAQGERFPLPSDQFLNFIGKV